MTKQEKQALRDYVEGKISFERLAERLDISVYELHEIFRHYDRVGQSEPSA